MGGTAAGVLKAAMAEVAVHCHVNKFMGAQAVALRGFLHRPPELLIAMERAEGSVLDHMQQRGGKLGLLEGVRCMRPCSCSSAQQRLDWCNLQVTMALQVSQALVRLHSINVIHRDISPRNILRSSADFWQVADFGIALVCSTTMALHTSTAACNYDYCPPEQTEEGGRVTDKSDVWALAATALHALTGARPYGEATLAVILRAHMEGRSPVVPSNQLPLELSALLRECMSIDSSARPTPAAVHARLKAIRSQLAGQAASRVLEQVAIASTSPESTHPTPQPVQAATVPTLMVPEQPAAVTGPARVDSPTLPVNAGSQHGVTPVSAAARLAMEREAAQRDAADKVRLQGQSGLAV